MTEIAIAALMTVFVALVIVGYRLLGRMFPHDPTNEEWW